MRGRRTKLKRTSNFDLKCGQREVLVELFHALAQPLTSLSCSLSSFLKKPQQLEQSVVKELLKQVETITWITNSIRALIDAAEVVPRAQTCEVADQLVESISELLPVAASKNVKLSLTGDHLPQIQIDQEKLRLAIFYLLDFALHTSRKGTRVAIETQQGRTGKSVLRVQLPSFRRVRKEPGRHLVVRATDDLRHRTVLAIARTILETAEARFQQRRIGDRLFLEFHLPPASRETDQPLTRRFRRPA